MLKLSHFLKKITVFQKKNLVKRVTLSNMFANLFHVWLNRKQLNFHICICPQAVVICYSSWRWIKSGLIWIHNWKGKTHRSPKRFLGSGGFSDYTLRTNDLAPPEYYSTFPLQEASPLVWEFWPQASFEKTEAGKRPYGKTVTLKVWGEAQEIQLQTLMTQMSMKHSPKHTLVQITDYGQWRGTAFVCLFVSYLWITQSFLTVYTILFHTI